MPPGTDVKSMEVLPQSLDRKTFSFSSFGALGIFCAITITSVISRAAA